MSAGKRKHSSSPERKEINKHLWSMHGQRAGEGSTLNRLVEHEGLHALGNDGYAGKPLHRHEPGTEERMGEVVQHEGEGT